MFSVISAVVSHLYSNFFSMYIWGKMLGGKKYAVKTMVIFTFVYVIIECILKLFLFQRIGFNTVILTSAYAYISHTIFIIILFQSSLGKKILVSTVSMIVMIFMEVFALNVTTFIFGNFELLQLNSWYTIVECTICNIFITIGLYLWLCFWKVIERIKWESYKNQWLCLILPISQWIMVLQLTQMHSVDTGNYPMIVIGGIMIGIFADVYMFYLFHQSNNREKVEKELRQVNHQYELEKIRYEQLQDKQEEVVTIRHDFQNYVLILKNMKK